MQHGMRLLLAMILLTLGSCGGPAEPRENAYEEFGPEFLQQVVERFVVRTDKPVEFKRLYVLWAMELHMPPRPEGELREENAFSVLCLCTGTFNTGEEVWRLFHVNRTIQEGKVVWSQAFRARSDNEGEYHGARTYKAKPTVEELAAFVDRARLNAEVAYYCQKLEFTKTKSRMYFVESKAYPSECNYIFGSVPVCLKQVSVKWLANEPKPDITLPAIEKKSGLLEDDDP
jgi:hypothetical protein